MVVCIARHLTQTHVKPMQTVRYQRTLKKNDSWALEPRDGARLEPVGCCNATKPLDTWLLLGE